MKSSNIGGQAVLEGIMMKHNNDYAVAVRKTDGEIVVSKDTYHSIGRRWGAAAKFPFVRGVVGFVDSMILGMRTLNYSASFFIEEEKDSEKEKGKEGQSVFMILVTVFSFALAIVLFMIIPYLISLLFKKVVVSYALRTVIEGMVRIGIFVIYIAVISTMSDIKRTFMYHGAEHKCINCIESGLPLTVENVEASSRQHRRCGTSFIFFVMIISIILLMCIPISSVPMRILIRILLLPVIAGISYEILKLAGRSDNVFIRVISWPGMGIQKMTTREPDQGMIEVAIQAVEAVFDWKDYEEKNFDTGGYAS